MQAGKLMPDDGLEHLREQLYERAVQEVNRMPFFQKLHQRINQYREITGHLAQARATRPTFQPSSVGSPEKP